MIPHYHLVINTQSQKYEVDLDPTDSTSALSIGRHSYKISGDEEMTRWVMEKIRKLPSSQFRDLDSFRIALMEDISGVEKIRNIALESFEGDKFIELSRKVIVLLNGDIPLGEFLELYTDDFTIGPGGECHTLHEVQEWIAITRLLSQGYTIEHIQNQGKDERGVHIEAVVINQLTGGPQAIALTFEDSDPPKLKNIFNDPAVLPVVGKEPLTDAEISQELQIFVSHLAEKGAFSGAILYARNGEVHCRFAVGLANKEEAIKNKKTTKFNLASVGKVLTAAAIRQLIEDSSNDLSYDTTLAEILEGSPFIQKLPEGVASKITIRHLSSHTSGLSGNYHEKLDAESISTLDFLEDFFSLVDWPEEVNVGEGHYCNTNYLLLGAVIERVTGQNFRDYLKSSVMKNMPNTGFDTFGPGTEELACGYSIAIDTDEADWHWEPNLKQHVKRGGPDGGCVSNIDDLFVFCQEYLKTASLDASDQMPGIGAESGTPEIGLKVGHDGGFPGVSTSINMFPETGEVLIILSNQGNGRGTFLAPITGKFLDLRQQRK